MVWLVIVGLVVLGAVVVVFGFGILGLVVLGLIVLGVVAFRLAVLGLFMVWLGSIGFVGLFVIRLVALELFAFGFDTNGLDGHDFAFVFALRDVFSFESSIDLERLKWKRRTSSMRENSLMLPFSTRTYCLLYSSCQSSFDFDSLQESLRTVTSSSTLSWTSIDTWIKASSASSAVAVSSLASL